MGSSVRSRAFTAIVLTGVVGVTAAHAATPGSGTVSRAQPTVSWKGELTAPYASYIQMFATEGAADTPCDAPRCDRFELEVGDGPGTLKLTMRGASPDSGFVSVRIIKPDRSTIWTIGDAKTVSVSIRNAPNGKYMIDATNGSKVSATYEATAELALPDAGSPPPSGGSPAAPPSSSPGPSSPSGPSSGPQAGPSDFQITVKAPRVSARKLKRSRAVRVTVTTSRAVKSIKATLKRGKRVVGKGVAGKTARNARIRLKVGKRLKAGRYALTVAATDGNRVSVTRTVTLKIRR